MALQTTMMESRGTLKRPKVGRDTAGGVTSDPFTTLLTGIFCSVSPAGASVQDLYAQRNQFINTSIYFIQDIGARPNDTFIVVDELGTTHTFLVKGYRRTLFGHRLAPWAMDCEEVQ